MNHSIPATHKILVTGGSGLLGNELIAQLLSAGKKITAIYNNTAIQGFSNSNLELVQCNLLDVIGLEEVMDGVSELYHCAGKVSFAAGEEQTLFKINVEGTANIVNAALNAGIRKMVHVSSVSALGRIRPGESVDETMHWTEETSNSKYGQSKYLGEMEVWRGIAEGLNAVIVNPVIILGAGSWEESSTKIFKTVYNEFPWYTEGSSGFVDVADVAKAMILLMESDVNAERFIVSAENTTYRHLFNMMADAFGKKRPSKKVNPLLASLVWRWELIKSKITGQIPLLTKETALTAQTQVAYNNNKLLKQFPQFQYHRLDQSVHSICNALQQKLNIR